MIRNLKALGLAIFGALALSAVAASAVHAATHHLTVVSAPATITGGDTVNTLFHITNGENTVECTTTKYEGTLSATTNTSTTVTPTYSECSVLVFGSKIAVTVDVNHCAYLFGGVTDVNGHATFEIECAAENEITITYSLFGSACIIHVTPQSTSQGSRYVQVGDEVEIESTVTGIKYHETGNGFCPETHTGTDGALTAVVNLKAFKDTGSAQTETAKTTPTLSEVEAQKLTLNANAT